MTYLIWVQKTYEISDRYCTAEVPDKNGGTMRVDYTVMTAKPDEIKWPHKEIRWKGARKDIRNIQPHAPVAQAIQTVDVTPLLESLYARRPGIRKRVRRPKLGAE